MAVDRVRQEGEQDGTTTALPARAMILAAGLGLRMRPLTDYRAKPALPVCGRPVISLLLELLAHHGVREVMINLHHRPETIRAAVALDHPANMRIEWSEEPAPLGTGGGLERAAEFLRGTPECLVMAGDMLLDVDLAELLAAHRASDRDVTLVLRSDARADDFGTIGFDTNGRVTRIGRRPLTTAPGVHPGIGPEVGEGLFTSVRIFSRGVLEDWPVDAAAGSDETGNVDRTEHAFEDLRDWLAPRACAGDIILGTEIVSESASVWEPVGTPGEYLGVNLSPPSLPSLGGAPESWCGDVRPDDWQAGCVIARTADRPSNVEIERCVVWDGEHLPAGFRGQDGVFAGDAFHQCLATESGSAP